jgi:hypothetical protein
MAGTEDVAVEGGSIVSALLLEKEVKYLCRRQASKAYFRHYKQ